MKPLPTSQRVMVWLCMCTADESTSKIKRMCHATFTLIMGTFFFSLLLSDVALTIKYLSIDVEKCLYAVFQIGAHISMLNLIIVGLINRHRIAALFTNLAKLYTANETETSFRFLAEANNKSEWLWKIYFKFGMIGVFVNMLVSTVASIIYGFQKYGVFDAENLYKPFIFLFPWNQNTPFGYFGDIVISLLNGECYILCNGAVIILFISMCWHHRAFYRRFSHTALKLDHPENKHNANDVLRELIHFHISVKDFFLESAEVYSPLVLIQLICNVIFMAAVVFELDLRLNRIDFEIFLLLNAFVIGVSNLYVFCYFGQLGTENYEKMAECLYESNWYELSLDLRKKSLLMILNMQQPVVYHGFGVAVLNLQTFIKLFRSIFTYYMMFKTLTE